MEGGVVVQLEGGLCSRGVGQGSLGGKLPSMAMRGVDLVCLGHDAGLGINPAEIVGLARTAADSEQMKVWSWAIYFFPIAAGILKMEG